MERPSLELDEIIGTLKSTLPPLFPRSSVSVYGMGLISPRTLANLASLGKGPVSFKSRGKVIYQREKFISWMAQWLNEGQPLEAAPIASKSRNSILL